MSTSALGGRADEAKGERPLQLTSSLVRYGPVMGSGNMLSQAIQDRYRCPEGFLNFALRGELSSKEGYFRFGPNTTGHGRACTGRLQAKPGTSPLDDLLREVEVGDGELKLPFDPNEVIDNLRFERYTNHHFSGPVNTLKRIYYKLRPIMTPFVRRQVQRFHARNWQQFSFPHWPVDTGVEDICETLFSLSLQASAMERVPFVWFWPRAARGCVAMTHDVETKAGLDFCLDLMDIDDSFGMKTSFQIVPEERYAVPASLLERIRCQGFEVGVQDLNHDGRLFDDREEFLRRAKIINQHGGHYGARGFRSAVLYRRPEWFDALNFAYDMSMPNVAHLDPQRGGCCTVMPYFIGELLELPVTTTQDYTLFHLLNERSISLWRTQVELILKKNGLASFIVHPDYIRDLDTRSVYEELLNYLRQLREEMAIWFALPHEIDSWWRARSKMSVVKADSGWKIVGEGAERATLAYARNVNGKLVYEQADPVQNRSQHSE
jgi:hypothetical protein